MELESLFVSHPRRFFHEQADRAMAVGSDTDTLLRLKESRNHVGRSVRLSAARWSLDA